MTKITTDSVQAFLYGKPFKRSNMEVRTNVDFHIPGYGDVLNGVALYQHGNQIAGYDASKPLLASLSISNCGWYSYTTKERLNEVLGWFNWRLSSVKGEWVLWSPHHGEEIPFNGFAKVLDLVELSNTIREERKQRMQA